MRSKDKFGVSTLALNCISLSNSRIKLIDERPIAEQDHET
jgi:hypothetical protein